MVLGLTWTVSGFVSIESELSDLRERKATSGENKSMDDSSICK